jgi:hypothetical protein
MVNEPFPSLNAIGCRLVFLLQVIYFWIFDNLRRCTSSPAVRRGIVQAREHAATAAASGATVDRR